MQSKRKSHCGHCSRYGHSIRTCRWLNLPAEKARDKAASLQADSGAVALSILNFRSIARALVAK